MTRIRMDWENLTLTAEGHAGAGTAGNDIVCAGISVLTQTLLNTLLDAKARGRTRLKWEMDEEKGLLKIDATPYEMNRHEIWSYFRMTAIGLRAIAQHYPEHIKITEAGGMSNGYV